MDFEFDIIFDAKAVAVPYNYRITYKVSLICLIIDLACVRGGASSTKIHMITVALNDPSVREDIEHLIQGNYLAESIPLRFDPSVNRAINYALADNLITRQVNGNFKLTTQGKLLVEQINSDESVMSAEKLYLRSIGGKLSERIISSVSKDWGIKNA